MIDDDELERLMRQAWVTKHLLDLTRQREENERLTRLVAALCVARPINQGEDDEKIYYVRRRRDGYVKIGRSRNVLARLGQLRKEHGSCDLLALETGDHLLETARHRCFATLRRDGEWFVLEDHLLTHIEYILKGVYVGSGNLGSKTAIGLR